MRHRNDHARQETKAQRAERLKLAKNPWESLKKSAVCASGPDAVPDAWIKTYFRWWGVYTQGDGGGAIAVLEARDGPPVFHASPSVCPMALFNATRCVLLPGSRKVCGGIADITVRQNIQLPLDHNQDLPARCQTLLTAV